MIWSTANPESSWIEFAFYLLTVSHTSLITSLLDNLSKIPSHAKTIKSWSFLIRNAFISGSAIRTLGLPPFETSFASISPKLLLTDNLPGRILWGPVII